MSKNSFNGELLHFNAVRFRIVGSGTLQSQLLSLDSVSNSTDLPDLTLEQTTNREPLLLAQFIDQRAQLFITTTEIDEVMNVSKIVIFVKPIASGYPQ